MAQQFSTDPTLKLIKPFESGELMTAARFNEIVEALNEQLKKQKRLCDAIEGVQDWSGTEVGDALDDLMGYSDAVKE